MAARTADGKEAEGRKVDGKGTVGKAEDNTKEADGKVEGKMGVEGKAKERARGRGVTTAGQQTTERGNVPTKVEEREEEAKAGNEAVRQMAISSAIRARA